MHYPRLARDDNAFARTAFCLHKQMLSRYFGSRDRLAETLDFPVLRIA
jgi:hypothetical protein